MEEQKAKTEELGLGKRYIPRRSLNRIGAIFLEGIPKYGENNWHKGYTDVAWQKERYEHAMEHLLKWYEGDRTEDHLAKVAWFCVVMLEFNEQAKVDAEKIRLLQELAAKAVKEQQEQEPTKEPEPPTYDETKAVAKKNFKSLFNFGSRGEQKD